MKKCGIAIVLFLVFCVSVAVIRAEATQGRGRLRDFLRKNQSNFQNAGETAGGEPRSWKIEGVDREALLYLPPDAKKAPSPVIFAFHGHGGSSRNAARTFGYQNLWGEVIVVYMQGLPTPGAITDPTGKLPGWQKGEGDQNDRDLKFFDAVLATLKKEYQVDTKRVFCAGRSNGGAFTFLLWAQRGENFAAFAPASATASTSFGKLKPKPAIQIGGENDPLVRFAGQKRTMDYVRTLNSCEPTGAVWAKSGDLTATLYPSKSDTPFVTAIYPGSHKFPAEAPPMIVKFFKEQTAKETSKL